MPIQHNFEHLPLLLRYQGRANIRGGGKQSPQTQANKNNRPSHSHSLRTAALSVSTNWQSYQNARQSQNLPVIPQGVPVLLQVDPNFDLDVLRDKFAFEIVAEQEEGFVIVASQDLQMSSFMQMVNLFAAPNPHGSAIIASIHKLFDDPTQEDRLRRLLSEQLLETWQTINDSQDYIVDIGIACTGTQEIPASPERGKRESDSDWARKQSKWAEDRSNAYITWDDLKSTRETEINQIVSFYSAEIIHNIDGSPFNSASLPDSFTIRLKIIGKGLRDFVLSYPYIFEVVEPEDIALPQRSQTTIIEPQLSVAPVAPDYDAPAVCVIDSGIQEEHILLEPAIDHTTSHCFLPGKTSAAISDEVRPDGHGTRVAGAVLYGENVIKNGNPKLPFWIQNARVLDEECGMPPELFPPAAIRAAVELYHNGARKTRIFNHSINTRGGCRTRYMSAWAAEIDALCAAYDVLVIQSAGNLPDEGVPPYIGVKDHLVAGRAYPDYLNAPSCRVANPAQSLQALTVGSVAYGAFESDAWRSFATDVGHPSSFSRTGFGIWNVIKPEVVEYGGDGLHTSNNPPDVKTGGQIPESCPELVRSTMFPPGPATARDRAGTSFAAPKVTRIAARLQQVLPNEPALLYRALIVQSARWPEWANQLLVELRSLDPRRDQARRQELFDQANRVLRCLGYGIPDETRATSNTDFRTTLISSGDILIRPRECHIYQVPIPSVLQGPAEDYDVLIEATLSYVSQPRRTRRHLRRYLSTWVDWKSSKLGEELNVFRLRAMKDDEEEEETESATEDSSILPWTLHENPKWGFIREAKRTAGTVQKDWAIVKSNKLRDHFCIAVVGHPGWSRDPDAPAKYSLAVTFEILGQEIPIYEPLRAAVLDLQSQLETEIENEATIEIEE